MYRVVIALILMQLVACSALPSSSSNSKSKPIYLEFSEPNRIQFQGKGAGAGIALMSTMGPVGIALGVAIDEGIAKDIRKAIGNEKGDVQDYIKNQMAGLLNKHGYFVPMDGAELKENYFPKLVIKRVGFKITNGSTDATAAEWELELHSGPDAKTTVSYPKDFAKDTINTHVLADLKVDGELGIELLDEGLVRAMDALQIKAHLNN